MEPAEVWWEVAGEVEVAPPDTSSDASFNVANLIPRLVAVTLHNLKLSLCFGV